MIRQIYLVAAVLCGLLAAAAHAGTVTIGWDATPDADGYRVWKGIQLVKTVKGTQATVTLPDSGIQALSVTAYNVVGESPHTTIKLVPVVVQTSNELKIWQTLTTLYVEVSEKMFSRLTPPNISP